MATFRFHVPDDLKKRIDDQDDVNWRAVIRRHLEAELAERSARTLALAVATSERLSRGIDAEAVAAENTAAVIRSFRDRPTGEDGA